MMVSMSTSRQTIDTAGSSRHGFGFWAVAFAFLATVAYCAIPTPLYSIYQQRDGFSSFTITIIYAAYAFGVAISLFTVGHLSDSHGRRRLVVPALVTSIFSALLFLLWRDLTGLIVARFISGLGVGAITATATAWLAELHSAHRPLASIRRAQVVATAANLGGIGLGPLVGGMLAQWVAAPLTVPYLLSLLVLAVALLLVLASPETRAKADPLPPYRVQRVSVPGHARGRYLAATAGAAISFAAFGLFNSLAPAFLVGSMHDPSHVLAGLTAFLVFGAGVVAQLAFADRSPVQALAAGIAILIAGLTIVTVSVWLPAPSLAMFLAGGTLTGVGAGSLFKGAVAIVAETATPETRAEALAGMFLAGYIGLSLPVVGLGALTQFLSPATSLLIFAGALCAGILLSSPLLFARPIDEASSASRSYGPELGDGEPDRDVRHPAVLGGNPRAPIGGRAGRGTSRSQVLAVEGL